MGLYKDLVLPRIIDVVLSGPEFDRLRARAASDLFGEVVEIGFGSGRNISHYPSGVSRVVAVDPAVAVRRLAAKRAAHASIDVEYVGLDGEDLLLDDASVDHALSTWTLCTIPSVELALAEIHRVLRPGGTLHFVEHGRSPREKVARWQDRLTPLQRRIAGGCHLNRKIDELIVDAGFEMVNLHHPSLKGPEVFTYLYAGIAARP